MDGFIYGYTEAGDPITDIMEFEAALVRPERAVARTDLGCIQVWTSHLVTDYNFGRPGSPPLTYETLVQAGPDCPAPVAAEWDLFTDRYSTRVSALAMHDQYVESIKAGLRQVGAPDTQREK